MVENKNDNKCKRCDKKIQKGHRYCEKHYKEALDEYEKKLSAYNEELKHWDSKTVEGKNAEHELAEDHRISIFYIIGSIALFLSTAWMNFEFVLGNKSSYVYKIENYIKLTSLSIEIKQYIAIFSLAFFYFVPIAAVLFFCRKFNNFVGRLTRVIFYSSIKFAVLFIIMSIYSAADKTSINITYVTYAAAISFIWSAISELRGSHHASAVPIKPVKPSR